LPDGLNFAALSTIAVDRRGRVYAFQRTDPPVVVFEPSGAFHAAWGEGLVADAHGIHVSADDRVFLVDRDAHQVLVFGCEGEELMRLGERHGPRFQAPFNHPTGVATAADGEVYVADGYANAAVHRFAANGRHLATWGAPGAAPGQFMTPHAVLVDAQDRVLVVDRDNDRVQAFDRAGGFLAEWRDFYHPMAIAEDDQGMLLVTDQVPRLSMYAPDGRLAGRCRGVWNGGHGVAANARGDVFLAEMHPNRITKLTALD
jgi:peptidylglycine monooxygenase